MTPELNKRDQPIRAVREDTLEYKADRRTACIHSSMQSLCARERVFNHSGFKGSMESPAQGKGG